MHSIPLILLFMSSTAVWQVSSQPSPDFCSQYCLDASRCIHYNCYYSWKVMHCYANKYHADLAQLQPSTYTQGFSVCFNVGGNKLVANDGYTFHSDLTNGLFGLLARRYDISGANIQGAGNDQHLYRSGREGPIIYYALNIIGQYEDLQVRLYFAELAYRNLDQRNLQIKFNGHVIRSNMDLIKDAGFSTAHIVYFPIKRAGRDLVVYERTTSYPIFGLPMITIRNLRTSFLIPLLAHLSGICVHRMIDCTKLCNNRNACNAAPKCVFDWKTNHCLHDTQVKTDKECEQTTFSYIHPLDKCLSCVQTQYCSYDPVKMKCHSLTSPGNHDYLDVQACRASLPGPGGEGPEVGGPEVGGPEVGGPVAPNPSIHNGNPGRCRELGFGYCCETQTCVLSQESCQGGCVSYCYEIDKCEANGCLFTPDNQCLDCSIHANNAETCRAKGCSFCCDTNQCHPKADATCAGGCSSNCFDPNACNEAKCSYNPTTNECQDPSIFNKNPMECRENGFEYCCESSTCHGTLPASCLGNCTNHCFNEDQCGLDGCSFNKDTGECVDCAKFGGDVVACQENNCEFCCLDHTCKVSIEGKCDYNKCSGHCFKPLECLDAGCQYNNATNGCYDCSEFHHQPQQCRDLNCKFCCETDLCEPNCAGVCETTGCVSNCFDRKKCTSEGCVFLGDTGTCFDCEPIESKTECIKHCAYCCDTGKCQAEVTQNCVRGPSPDHAYAADVVLTIYEDVWFRGRASEIKEFDFCPGCRNLPDDLKNSASGIKTGGLCFYLFDEDDCDFAKDHELICGDDDDFRKLKSSRRDFNDKLNSILLDDANTKDYLNKECEKHEVNVAKGVDACVKCIGNKFCSYDPETKKCGFVGATEGTGQRHTDYHQCTADPNLSNGNPENCRERGFIYCCDTQKCETEGDAENCESNKSCGKNCFDRTTCEQEGCLYTVKNECVNCAKFDNDATSCRSNGCSYCCDTGSCRAYADGSCPGGCSQNCHDPDACTSAKCVYDHATKVCEDCSVLNGKPTECRTSGCQYCCETATCHAKRPDQCNARCVEYCSDQMKCEMNDCLYSPFSERCSDCSTFDYEAVACRANGCDYCCATETCHVRVSDSCPGGCSQKCFLPKECNRENCFYNPEDNICEGCSIFNGERKKCKSNGCSYCCNTKQCHDTPPANCKTKCYDCRGHHDDARGCIEDGCAFCCHSSICQSRTATDCVDAPPGSHDWAKHVTFNMYLERQFGGNQYSFSDFDICPACRLLTRYPKGNTLSVTVSNTCFDLFSEETCSGTHVQVCNDVEDMDNVITAKNISYGKRTKSIRISQPSPLV